jgi:hypothetical protein
LNERFEPETGAGGGAITAKRKWLLYAEKTLAPLRRKFSGSFTPKTKWLHCGEN